ncbi:hypothetical protein GTW43_27055, partial [Streptomyces sp. SID5785]|nr:hypothetical protein [Streptomyces sp. SID5785]
MPGPDRSLAALGLDGVPATDPLSYPGRPAPGPALLTGGALLPLEVPSAAHPLGAWPVDEGRPPGAGRRGLDSVLADRGRPGTARRVPVLAVGSNASPGQLTHKLTRAGLDATVPMVPVRVRGVAVGCSGHISPPGYVAAAPYLDPAVTTTLVATWLDPAQLDAVDATERAHYRRALLPGGR